MNVHAGALDGSSGFDLCFVVDSFIQEEMRLCHHDENIARGCDLSSVSGKRFKKATTFILYFLRAVH